MMYTYLTPFIKFESDLCGLETAAVGIKQCIAPQLTTGEAMAESMHISQNLLAHSPEVHLHTQY